MDDTPSTEAEGSAIDEDTGLPNLAGWLAVLRIEERRAWRHGGGHALGIVELAADSPTGAGRAADAIVTSVRETDVVALVAPGVFAVLALHCEAPDLVAHRLHAALAAAPSTIPARIRFVDAGDSLVAAWRLLRQNAPGAGATEPGLRDFTAVRRPCLN